MLPAGRWVVGGGIVAAGLPVDVRGAV